MVGIGDARDNSAVVQMGCFSAEEMAQLRAHGAVGDMLGFFFDRQGRPARLRSVEQRVIAVAPAELLTVDTVIGIVSEADKADAVRGGARDRDPERARHDDRDSPRRARRRRLRRDEVRSGLTAAANSRMII